MTTVGLYTQPLVYIMYDNEKSKMLDMHTVLMSQRERVLSAEAVRRELE